MAFMTEEFAQEIPHDTGIIYDENASHGMSPLERGIYRLHEFFDAEWL
jgi:hypothetical protein